MCWDKVWGVRWLTLCLQAKSSDGIDVHLHQMNPGIVIEEQYPLSIKQCQHPLLQCQLHTYHLLQVHVHGDSLSRCQQLLVHQIQSMILRGGRDDVRVPLWHPVSGMLGCVIQDLVFAIDEHSRKQRGTGRHPLLVVCYGQWVVYPLAHIMPSLCVTGEV